MIANDRVQKICKEIDNSLTSSKLQMPFWKDFMVRRPYRDLRDKLIHEVDWSWTLSDLSDNERSALPIYQLFLFCKFVAEDYDTTPTTTPQLCPTPLIESIWKAHILRSEYIEMHEILLQRNDDISSISHDRRLLNRMETSSIDVTVQLEGLEAFRDYMYFLCPKLRRDPSQILTLHFKLYIMESSTVCSSHSIWIRVFMNSPFSLIRQAYQNRIKNIVAESHNPSLLLNNEIEGMRLRCNGIRIKDNDTSESLELEDGDLIEAYFDICYDLGIQLITALRGTTATISDPDVIKIVLRGPLHHGDVCVRIPNNMDLERVVTAYIEKLGISRDSITCRYHHMHILLHPNHSESNSDEIGQICTPMTLHMKDDDVIDIRWFQIAGI